MPLYTHRLKDELARKREHFTGYSDRFGHQLDAYRTALGRLGERYPDAATLTHALSSAQSNASRQVSLGALPTREFDAWRAAGGRGLLQIPFGETFAHHEAARAWAERLRGTTTLAVDGSQLLPWRDASVPVALVQAGIFENPHEPPAPYLKDVVTEVLGPDELTGTDPDIADARTGEVLGYSERAVHLRRYELEVKTLIARMKQHARQSGESPNAASVPVVAFYDGSLIVSFALKMPPPYKERYVAASRALLAASQQYRVPVLGYIDTSYARDLVTMLRTLASLPSAGIADPPLPDPQGLHDSQLFRAQLGWGERTVAFLSARDDLERMGYGEQRSDIAFVYFQAALDRPPARIELPRWILDAGLLDGVIDVVRAETIVGNGYPYPIEAADAVAVISMHDRAQFYALFQEWAEREGLPFTFSRKALSKSRRRV
ncbi:MAG TPA: DNA double-strand break repair nuclease NurA [Ktedonobacterales bacterium]